MSCHSGRGAWNALLLLLAALLLGAVIPTAAVKCHIGYGQRGKNRNYGFEWPRDCPDTDYCWEAVTSDIERMRMFFDFAWDDYYESYYVRACGGEWGTDLHLDPYQFYYVNGKRIARKKLPGRVYRMNVTTPPTITGRGGTALMDISYICRGNFCASAAGLFSGSALGLALLLTAAGSWLAAA